VLTLALRTGLFDSGISDFRDVEKLDNGGAKVCA
jgi:hypothetical protein